MDTEEAQLEEETELEELPEGLEEREGFLSGKESEDDTEEEEDQGPEEDFPPGDIVWAKWVTFFLSALVTTLSLFSSIQFIPPFPSFSAVPLPLQVPLLAPGTGAGDNGPASQHTEGSEKKR